MKNQQGFVWAPVLIMSGVVIIFLTVGYFALPWKTFHKCPLIGVQCKAGTEQYDNHQCIIRCTPISHNDTNATTSTNSATNSNQVANNNAGANANTSIDQTTGWKSYSNQQYGFSIKYPNNLKATEDSSEIYDKTINIVSIGDPQNKDYRTVSVHYITRILDPKNIYTAYNTGLKATKSTIGGRDAYSISGYSGGSPLIVYQVSSWDGNGIIEFQFGGAPTNKADNPTGIVYPWYTDPAARQVVLNTITFTNPTTAWKTYINTTNNYSIKYPPSWKVSEELVPKHNTVQILPPDAVNKTSPEQSPALFIIPNQTYQEHHYVINNDPENDAYSNWRTQIINGISVKRQHQSGLSTSDVAYFSTASGKYIQVSWDVGFVSDYPEYEQILATFQFTN